MKPARRQMLLAAAALVAAPLVRAQTAPERRTLGVLTPHPRSGPERDARLKIYRAHFEQLGWRRDENLIVEQPEHQNGESALAAMAEELVRRRVDAILAVGSEAAVAAARATKTIPIVFWGVGYPVEQGLIASFARPGGNVTGVAFFTGTELLTKLLEIFREIAPHVSRVAAIATPSSMSIVRGGRYQESGAPVKAVAQSLGFHYRAHAVSRVEDFESVFAEILGSRAQGIVTFGSTLVFRNRQRIVEFARRNRLPHGANQVEFVEAGGLFSYGANTVETNLRSFDYVDKVLRGANPAELPVERPARYELAVNMGTARALELEIPASMLLRADRVME
jgi:putative ABC transport system substrate-binding protein